MRTLIKDPRAIFAAACLLVFAICIELHSDPSAIHRERATGSSLRANAVNVHMTLNRLPVGKGRLSSLAGQRHSRNELMSAPIAVPGHQLGLAGSVSYAMVSASSVPERHPYSIRPPPAS